MLRVAKASTKKTPKLATVLFTVLDKAGCNRISSHPRSVSKDTAQISAALRGFYMDDQARIPALQFFGTNLHRFNSIAAVVRAATTRNDWPPKIVPHGFVVGLCELSIDDQKRRWLLEPQRGSAEPKRWEVTGRMRLPGAGTIGPYVAIGLVAIPKDAGEPEIVQAYVHPANSLDDLTLVDSDLERRTLSILMKCLSSSEGTSVVKPYLDILGRDGGESYRPDFIVKRNSKTCYVETMGYEDEEYRSRKAEVHKRMERYHLVIEHDPGINDEEFEEEIEAFLGRK